MDPTSLLVTREDLPEAIVMTPRASHILEGTPALEAFRAALASIAEGESKRVILDFHEVSFLSSACLGNLIVARRKLMIAGQSFVRPVSVVDPCLRCFPTAKQPWQCVGWGRLTLWCFAVWALMSRRSSTSVEVEETKRGLPD